MKRKALLLIIPFAAAGLAGCEQANPNPPEPSPQCDTATVSIKTASGATSATIKPGATLQLSAVVNVESCTFDWSSSNDDLATVSQNGLVTAGDQETDDVVIKYGPGSFHLAIQEDAPVYPTKHDGTATDPLDGADAMAVANTLEAGGVTKESFYIKGKVQKLEEEFSADHGNYSFSIEEGFICWRLKNGASGEKFNDGDIAIGDEVTVYAQIQRYGKEGKPETNGGYVVSVHREGAPVEESIESIKSGPTQVEQGGKVANDAYQLNVKMSDGSTVEKSSTEVICDTSAVRDDAPVTVKYMNLEPKSTTIKVVPASTSSMKEAYEAAEKLGKDELSQEFEFSGVVVGVRTNGTQKEYYVQDDIYGIDVYSPSYGNQLSIGKKVTIKSKLKNYSGTIETADGTKIGEDTYSSQLVKCEEGNVPEALDISSKSVLDSAKVNIRAKASGVISSLPTLDTTKDYKMNITVGSDTVLVFFKKNFVKAFEDKINSLSVGDSININEAVTGTYNADRQILITDNTTIEQGEPSHDPSLKLNKTSESVKVGADVVLTATVSNTENPVQWSLLGDSASFVSITPNGNSVSVHGLAEGTAKVKAAIPADNLEAICTVTIEKAVQPGERESLPYSVTFTDTGADKWEGDGEKFANSYYAMKATGKAISAVSLINEVSSLKVSIKGVCNDPTNNKKTSTVTVYGLDDSGNPISGASATFNPVNAVATKAEEIEAGAHVDEVTISGAGITGVKIELTEKGNNYILCSAVLESSTPVTPEVVSVAVTPKTAELPLNGTLQMSADVVTKGTASKEVNWYSSDESKATVDANGLVTPHAEGAVTITAKAKDKAEITDTATITVVPAAQDVLESIKALGYTTTVDMGATYTFDGKVYGHYTLSGDVELTSDWTVTTPIDTSTSGAKVGVITYSKDGDVKTCQFNVAVNKPAPGPIDFTGKEFELITSAADLEDGYYLLGADGYFFNGLSKGGEVVSASATDNKVTFANGMAAVYVEAMTGGHSIKIVSGSNNNGKYISGASGTNTINFGDTASACAITFADGQSQITSDSAKLCVNENSSTSILIRFMKSSTDVSGNYKWVSLYKMIESTPTPATLDSITASGVKTTYEVGDALDLTGLSVMGHYSDGDRPITEGITTSMEAGHVLAATDTSLLVSAGGKSDTITLTINPKHEEDAVLDSILVSSDHRVFYVGDQFVEETVTAHYNKGADRVVTGATFSGFDSSVAVGSQTITVSYIEGDVTKTTTYDVEIKAKPVLDRIEVATPPSTTVYTEGQTFDKTGLTVTAHYTNGKADATIGAASLVCTPAEALSESDTLITISYTEGDITKTCTQAITVNKASGEKGTLENPFTPEEAKTEALKLDETSSTSSPKPSEKAYYIKGTVSKLAKAFDSFMNYSFWLDDAFEGWQLFNGPNKEKFNDGDIMPGDEVIIYGKLLNFKGTPENATDAYVYSVKKGTVPVSIDEASSKNAQVTLTGGTTALNGSSYSFDVVANDGYELVSVKVNGVDAVKGQGNSYSISVNGPVKIIVVTKEAGQKDPIAYDNVSLAASGASKGCANYTTTDVKYTGSKVNIVADNFNNNSKDAKWDYIRAGMKNATSTATLKTESSISAEIISVEIDIGQLIRGSCTGTLYVANNSSFTGADEYAFSVSDAGVITINITNPMENAYYKIDFVCVNTTKDNGVINVKSVAFNYIPE